MGCLIAVFCCSPCSSSASVSWPTCCGSPPSCSSCCGWRFAFGRGQRHGRAVPVAVFPRRRQGPSPRESVTVAGPVPVGVDGRPSLSLRVTPAPMTRPSGRRSDNETLPRPGGPSGTGRIDPSAFGQGERRRHIGRPGVEMKQATASLFPGRLPHGGGQSAEDGRQHHQPVEREDPVEVPAEGGTMDADQMEGGPWRWRNRRVPPW